MGLYPERLFGASWKYMGKSIEAKAYSSCRPSAGYPDDNESINRSS